jgi:hypothetical protein
LELAPGTSASSELDAKRAKAYVVDAAVPHGPRKGGAVAHVPERIVAEL